MRIKTVDKFFCDICKVELHRKINYTTNTSVWIKRDGLDFSGYAVGDNSSKYKEVCDRCAKKIVGFIKGLKKN